MMTDDEKRAWARCQFTAARQARAEALKMPPNSPGRESRLGQADACRFIGRLFLRELRKK